MMSENRVRKYVLYALGEIFLVVIGIIIALQINSVNQKRLDRQAATNILYRLADDLDADFDRLSFIDSAYSNNLENIREVYDILAMDEIEDSKQLEKVALFSGADIKDVNSVRATFDEMVNTGNIYKLKNDALIGQIIEYYRLVDENTYQSREDRREFRNLFYGPELLDFWYIRSSSKNRMELAQEFFSNSDSELYKRVVQAANWSGGLISRGQNRNTELIEKNRALKESLQTELD
jgi:hypothetical protein